MSTRVKVIVAAVIIGALVVLIVLDSVSVRNTETAGRPAVQDEESIFQPRTSPFRTPERPSATARPPASPSVFGEQVTEFDLTRPVKEMVEKAASVSPLKGGPAERTPVRTGEIKGSGTEPIQVPVPPAAEDYYVIQPGDSYYKIAEKKYGDGNLWKLIADANPSLRANALKTGRKIAIPAKGEKREETTEPVAIEGGSRFYVVQPGDTLGAISKKLFGTVRKADAIFEMNRTVMHSADELVVGARLRLPEAAAAASEPAVPSAVEPVGPPMAGGTHKVEPGDSLWKIAEKYAGENGIQDMMERILEANRDRIPSVTTMLQVGWTLQIPR